MTTTMRPSMFRREFGDWLLNSLVVLAGTALAAPFGLILGTALMGVW